MIVRHLNLRAQAIRTIRQSRNIRCSWAVRGGPLVCEASTRRVSPRARQGRGRTPSVRQEPTPQGHRLHVGSVFPRGFSLVHVRVQSFYTPIRPRTPRFSRRPCFPVPIPRQLRPRRPGTDRSPATLAYAHVRDDRLRGSQRLSALSPSSDLLTPLRLAVSADVSRKPIPNHPR